MNMEKLKTLCSEQKPKAINPAEVKTNKLTKEDMQRILLEDERIKFVRALSLGHIYVWRLKHSERSFSSYCYSVRFIGSLRGKACYARYVVKFLKFMFHDTRISNYRKHQLLQYLYYYSTWTWPSVDTFLLSYFLSYMR